MVDAEKIVDPGETSVSDHALNPTSASGVSCAVRAFDDQAQQIYAEFCRSALMSTPQNPSFVSAWARVETADIILVSIEAQGRAAIMLPLEIAREGGFVLARYPGGRHANGNFPASINASLSADAFYGQIAQAVRTARPDVDLIALERNERERDGKPNPLLSADSAASPNIALACDLSGGFDALLERPGGRRKRKKYRSQTRKFEAAGGHHRVTATTPDEVDKQLAAFFEMKAARFRQMGITDVFAEDAVRQSFRRMFVGALSQDRPEFVLHGLEIGGILRAITGSSISRDRLTCEFSAFRVDELAASSPGDYLFFENIRQACDDGFAIYDFGVGDEQYKRLWCDIESRHFDLFLPLTVKGRLLSTSKRVVGTLKRSIKSNPAIWSMVKRLRKSKGREQLTEDDS